VDTTNSGTVTFTESNVTTNTIPSNTYTIPINTYIYDSATCKTPTDYTIEISDKVEKIIEAIPILAKKLDELERALNKLEK